MYIQTRELDSDNIRHLGRLEITLHAYHFRSDYENDGTIFGHRDALHIGLGDGGI